MFNTAAGRLQRQLHKGEYGLLKHALLFESDFIEITRRGEAVDIHNRLLMVTVGITCTSPVLLIPDVMLLARPAATCEELEGHGQAARGKKRRAAKALELTRLLPLKFVRISVHDREKQQLRLKFATGRSCYLQLCPPLDAGEDLFTCWEKLTDLLRPPVDSNSSTYATPAEDVLCSPAMADEDRASLAALDAQGKGDRDQVSVQSLHMVPSAASAGGEQIQPASPKVSTSKARSTESAGAIAPGKNVKAVAGGVGSGAFSVAATMSGSGGLNAALAGAASIGEGGSVAVAGSVGRFSGPVSSTASCFSPEDNMSAAFAGGEATSKDAGDGANTLVVGVMVSDCPGDAEAGEQGGPQPDKAACEERRERKEREKDKSINRGSYRRRTHEGQLKTGGNKMAQKSSTASLSGHRTHRASRKEKCTRRGARGSRQDRTPKSTRRAPQEEPQASCKSRESLSPVSSACTPERLSRFSCFLRNVRASFITKGAASLHGGDVDITATTVEKRDMETIVETAEGGEEIEVTRSLTSEVTGTVTMDAH